MKITREIYEKLVESAEKSYPNEAHGYLFNNNSIFEEGIPIQGSVAHFIASEDQLWRLYDKYGNQVPSAVFHSHPCQAIPSHMDLDWMREMYVFWGEIPSLILSNTYRLRAWIGHKEIEVEII